MQQDDYYVMESENNDDYPLFAWDQTSEDIIKGMPVNSVAPRRVRLSDPLSPGYKLVDYHVMPEPVLSTRFKNVIAMLNIPGIQLLPLILNLPKPKAPLADAYWLLHAGNAISCLDKVNSDVEYSKSGNTIFGIDKLVIDEKILGGMPLEKRLLFVLAENTSVYLLHKSVVETIQGSHFTGCRFFKVSEWNSDVAFD
ncbi:MAG: hypothetical protein HYZ31_09030 [Gammaproteobacteria bacterium]|jgi:hypothetical protein|nr:hypothetical protein [Gammaproteobacteria bacterium]